ncbi:MAG: anion permease [Erysipelotrichaceae bacterium]|nr:anion permease [Erysipelotrichaceae bacterium]MDD4641921.1 anion permease [Erysipelotrichaceae bacterium]
MIQKNKRSLIIVISLAFIILFRFIPAPLGLNTSAMQVIGTFIGVLILWLTIAIDWPSLLCLAALSFIPEIKVSSLLSGSIGSSTFAFLLFTFMCTYAVSKTSFIRRCALFFINSKLAKRGPYYFTISFFLSALILGMFMSPTVLFVIYLPILEEIYRVTNLQKTNSFANMLMIGMTISIAIASGMTPIAHVFSIMAIGFYETATGLTISYLQYMGFAIPIGVLTFIGMILSFRFILKPNTSVFNVEDATITTPKITKMDKREYIILSIFIIVILLWITPSFIQPLLPNVSSYINSFTTAMPPLLGAVAMLMIHVDNKPLLAFNEAMSKGISWGALIMTASTLALGSALTNNDIGLTNWLTTNITPQLLNLNPIVLISIFTIWAGMQTNLSSNMVTVTVVSAVALPIALTINKTLNPAAIACIIGLMASFSFATPPAHPNVALAGGSGWTSAKQMMFYGFFVMVIAIIITITIGYPLADMII